MQLNFLLGYHMDCLDPPLLEIPQGNWYCDDCFETSDESDDDPEEVDDLNNDIEEEMDMVQLAESRLRTRQPQPQILRTMQSERIRNAILARMSLRSAREAFGEGPSTAAPAASRARTVRKRRTTRRRKVRRRARTEVVEYDVDGSDKFAMRTRRVARKSRRKRRKVSKPAKRRVAKASAPSTGFKSSNANVHELQRGRQRAGLPNFNIFQPTNQLDYVPDEDENIEDSGIEESGENASGSVLTQAIIGLRNPQRRNMIIKNRVLQNCTTTSSVGNLLDTIMQDQSLFGPGSIGSKFAVEKSSGKLLFVGKNAEKVKQTSGGEETSPGRDPPANETNNSNPEPSNSSSSKENDSVAPSEVETHANQSEANKSSDDRDESQNATSDPTTSNVKESPDDKKKKPKKPAFDMFDENSNSQETDDCPNFSIYDSVDASVDPEGSCSFQMRPNVYDEENVDLVQMSDNEQNEESSEEAPPAIVASQPASPDLETPDDIIVESLPERSYTPPIAQKTSDDAPDKDDYERKKKEREAKRNRKRELERYNVRDRLKERSPVKLKDKFGRNRSRSRSTSRKKQARRRSRSVSRDRYKKSKSHERHRKSRSYTRSRSRRRTPSIEHDRKKIRPHKEKPTKVSRRSRSLTPRHHKPATPDRRARSRSKKPKKKKHCDHSKEKPSTLTKEVFTSGQNILVSVNFNNQEEKTAPKRVKNSELLEPKEIVDITARKKITISSKPVAIIDLARSPFRELTPEYQTNVIELSDSEGEEDTRERPPPKSPDSTLSSKLYDPFDILNSPPNENVTSSQNTAAQLNLQKQEKIQEPVKASVSYNKNVMAMATNSSLFFNEENLVSSSSSLLMNDKQIPLLFTSAKVDAHQPEKNASKTDIVPMDIVESPYSPGHEYDDSFPNQDDNGGAKSPKAKQAKGNNKGGNIFDELFGSSTPPGLDKSKNSKKGKCE